MATRKIHRDNKQIWKVQCTRAQTNGRTLKRHERQEILDSLRDQAQSRSSKRDIQTRQHFMERSFAQAKRFGFKRARWRGQWRVQILDYLIAVVQNIQLLIAHGCPRPRADVPAGTLMTMGQIVFVFLLLVSLRWAL